MPCAPYQPTAAITIHALKFYCITHLRCPHVSIHSFFKTLCDLHNKPFKPYLSRQFSITFDLYLSIQMLADRKVQVALNCDLPDWKLSNTCLSCTHVLQAEHKLKFSMLYTTDGNCYKQLLFFFSSLTCDCLMLFILLILNTSLPAGVHELPNTCTTCVCLMVNIPFPPVHHTSNMLIMHVHVTFYYYLNQ
jgi:hypothetical protein